MTDLLLLRWHLGYSSKESSSFTTLFWNYFLFVYGVGVINMKIQPVSSKRLFQNGCMNETHRAPYNSMFLSQNMNEKIIDGNI